MHPAGAQRKSRQARSVLVAATLALAFSGCSVMQFNIANGCSDCPPEQRRGQEAVKRMVREGNGPTVMTLQEVCEGRFHEIAAAIAPYGYHGHFDSLESPSCGGSGPGYGNAMFHQGGHTGWNGNPRGYHELHFSRNNAPGHRHAMAVGVNIGGHRAVIWTTHLEADRDSEGRPVVAAAQSAQLLAAVRFTEAASGLPQIVGGDFNLRPGEPSMGAWRNHFHEADGALRPTHAAGKIDYLLSSIPWKAVGIHPTSTSDHRRLLGWF